MEVGFHLLDVELAAVKATSIDFQCFVVFFFTVAPAHVYIEYEKCELRIEDDKSARARLISFEFSFPFNVQLVVSSYYFFK